jgi:dipeptidase E
MKLLLTSNGFSNQTIAKALFELVGKKPEDTTLVFVPTASNVEPDEKEWFIKDIINIHKQGFKEIYVTDISAVPESIWKPQFEAADVLFFEGGNTYHLMDWMNKSGLASTIREYLKTKVYVGLSAGSMVTAPSLNIMLNAIIYGEEANRPEMKGLGLVDFLFLPHMNNPHFGPRIKENLDRAMAGVTEKTYVLDDQSALKVVDGVVEYVGEGEYLEYN